MEAGFSSDDAASLAADMPSVPLRTVLDGVVSSVAYGDMNENDLVMLKLVVSARDACKALSDEVVVFLLCKLVILMMSRDGKTRNVRAAKRVHPSTPPPLPPPFPARASSACASRSPSSSLSTRTSSLPPTTRLSPFLSSSRTPPTTPASSPSFTPPSKPIPHSPPSRAGRTLPRPSRASASTVTGTSCTRAPPRFGRSSSPAATATAAPSSAGSARRWKRKSASRSPPRPRWQRCSSPLRSCDKVI